MPTQVKFEGVTHQFPDDFTQDDIRKALISAHGGSGQPPGIPKPPLPTGLIGPPAGQENSVGGAGNEPGLPAIVNQGIHQLGRAIPAFSNSWKRGASDVIEGIGKTLSPLAIPAVVAAPAATIGGFSGGTLANLSSSGIADAMGADPESRRLIGNLASIPGAILGGGAAESPAVRGFVSGATKAAPAAFKTALPAGSAGALLHHFAPGPLATTADVIAATQAIPPIYRAGVSGAAEKPLLGPVARDLFSAAPVPPYARPDYSDLLTMPGAGVPPYQSSVIPEPGSVARDVGARPVVGRSSGAASTPLPKPSVVVDWLGRPVTPETASVPAPDSFVSTSGSRLVEPWKPTVAINIDTPSGVKKVQIPTSAITQPPAAQPSSARAVALTKSKPTATPTFAPVGTPAPSQAELFQPPPATAQPVLAPPEGFLGSAEDQSRYLGNLVSGAGKNRHLISPAPIPIDTGVGGTDLNLYKPGYGQVVLGKPAEGGIEVFGKAQAGPKGIENLGVSPQYQGKDLSQVLLKEVDKSGFPVKSVPGNPVSTAGAAAINKYANPLESQVSAVPSVATAQPSALESQLPGSLPPDVAARAQTGIPSPVAPAPGGEATSIPGYQSRPEIGKTHNEVYAARNAEVQRDQTWDKDTNVISHIVKQNPNMTPDQIREHILTGASDDKMNQYLKNAGKESKGSPYKPLGKSGARGRSADETRAGLVARYNQILLETPPGAPLPWHDPWSTPPTPPPVLPPVLPMPGAYGQFPALPSAPVPYNSGLY